MTEKEAREVRLAAQLRANLRRRKASPSDAAEQASGGETIPSAAKE